jgi:hypothetical protein
MATIAKRVAAGAAFLDKHEPGWVERIDLDRLNLNHTCNCVLGQAFADKSEWSNRYYDSGYDYARARFRLLRGGAGFGFDTADDYEPYEPLAAEWKRVITERRKGDDHA